MKKQQARNLYFQTELSQTRIAELLDVDRKTIYLWIKEGRWAQIKKSAQHTPSILTEQYYSQLLAINQMIMSREEQPYPTQQEADIIRKLTLTIRNIKDGQTVGETIEVLMNFIHQLTKTDLDLAKQILPHADKYIKDYNHIPIIKPEEKMEIEEIEATEKELSEETPQQIPDTQTQPKSTGSLRGTKQSFATQPEKQDHATQSPVESENPHSSQTPNPENIEPPTIVKLPNYPTWGTNGQRMRNQSSPCRKPYPATGMAIGATTPGCNSSNGILSKMGKNPPNKKGSLRASKQSFVIFITLHV